MKNYTLEQLVEMHKEWCNDDTVKNDSLLRKATIEKYGEGRDSLVNMLVVHDMESNILADMFIEYLDKDEN